MSCRNSIVAMVLGLALVLAGTSPAEARNARGAFLHNSNSPDPTVPRHPHRYDFRSRRTFPDDSQCCASIPTIETLTCRHCGVQVESGTRLNREGYLERFRTRGYPRR